MVSEFWLEALLLSYLLFYDFMTLRSVLPITFFVKELRFPNPVHRALKTCQKPGVITRKSQLFNKKRCRHLNTGHLIKRQKMTHFHWKKVALRQLLVSFWACMTSIFHARQFFIKSQQILDTRGVIGQCPVIHCCLFPYFFYLKVFHWFRFRYLISYQCNMYIPRPYLFISTGRLLSYPKAL